ncbi:MAG: hypothetical protein EXQ70_04485 [Solirubrobacterales bacterium]|nr:hypothetical protein [Solirubrobacterales bacterium]
MDPHSTKAALVLACLTGLVLAISASAAAASTRGASPPVGEFPAPGTGHVRDTILSGAEAGSAALAGTSAQTFTTGDGYTISVRWDAQYSAAVAQQVVDFLESISHGPELGRLDIYLASNSHLTRYCGAGALACFDPTIEEMVIAGALQPQDGLSPWFVITHEYGHQVATNRSNGPWPAISWGPKKWATQERVCEGVRDGRFDPYLGYWNNPGEAFAEAFAFRHFPSETRWLWTLPHPDSGSYAAIDRDVYEPWVKNGGETFAGSLGGADPKDRFEVQTPYDGRLTAKLSGPSRADFDLYLLGAKRARILSRSAHSGRRETLTYTICGRGSLRAEVYRYSGGGHYELTVSRP